MIEQINGDFTDLGQLRSSIWGWFEIYANFFIEFFT